MANNALWLSLVAHERLESYRRTRPRRLSLGAPEFDGCNIVRCSMNVRRYSLNFAPRPAPRGRDGKELIQCPTSSCDGMGHVSGNYATHRRQGSIEHLHQDFLNVNARLCIYQYGDAARTHARLHYRRIYTHTHVHIHAPKFLCRPPL